MFYDNLAPAFTTPPFVKYKSVICPKGGNAQRELICLIIIDPYLELYIFRLVF
jgi:hypothetical protein